MLHPSVHPTHPRPMKARFQQLADLAALRETLAADAAAQEKRAREEAIAAAAALREANLFRDAVGAVEPLKRAARATHSLPPPEPIARQHHRDEAAALEESLSDGFDPDAVLDVDEQTSWRRPGVGVEILRKLRRGDWIVQSELDLHGWRTEGARDLVASFLREAVRQQHRCVRIVHGKGHGSIGKQPVLKGKVKGWLTQKDEVLAFCQAREHDGGGGALIVLLRPC
jgi:DNA-nicking Smr family endonuclease